MYIYFSREKGMRHLAKCIGLVTLLSGAATVSAGEGDLVFIDVYGIPVAQ